MNTSNIPPAPPLKTLLIACVVAITLALIILWTVVLPAEYGLDPTGFGKKYGLLQLSQHADTPKPNVIQCPTDALADTAHTWQDSVAILVPARSGLEYKFFLQKDATLTYDWKTDGGTLYYDFHGEPEGDSSGYFKSFEETTDFRANGKLNAPFSGNHGWYWENKTDIPITVFLKTRGQYKVLGLM